MNTIELGSSEHRRTSLSMLLGSIVTFAVLYSPQPLISLFSKEYHISPATAGASVSLATIGLAIGLIIISTISDRVDRKLLMSLSLLTTSVLAILSAFTPQFSLFLVIRFLIGISVSGFPSIAMAFLNEEFHPKAIGRVIGIYVAGTSIGGLVGRIVIGALTDLFNWQIALTILGVLSLLFSLIFWYSLPSSRNFTPGKTSLQQWEANLKHNFSQRNLLGLFLTAFLLMGVYIMILNYIGYPLTSKPYNLSQTVFGFLFVVNLLGTCSSVLFGKLADRYSRQHVIALAIGILLIGVLLTLSSILFLKIAGVAIVAFGFFAGHSVASGWVGIAAGREYKAQASALYLLFYYGGSSLVGWSGGLFFHRFGWNGMIAYASVLLVLAVLISWLAAGSRRTQYAHGGSIR